MWPAIIGGAISALGSFLGSKESADSAESQAAQNTALQKEFAQQGIRWRVEDAKAAGLHPLFALGGSGASFTPNPIHVGGSGIGPALEGMGQGVSRAVAAQATEEEQALRTAQLELIRAQTNATNAQAARDLAASEASRLGQAQVATFPLGYHPSDSGIASRQLAEENRHFRMGLLSAIPGQGGPGTKVPTDRVKLKPDEQVMSAVGDKSQGAGEHPFFREFVLHDKPGRTPVKILLPFSEEGPSEAMENLGLVGWTMVIRENVRRYGAGWLQDVWSGGGRLAHHVSRALREGPRVGHFIQSNPAGAVVGRGLNRR